MHVCLPGVLKTGSANLNFFQLFLSNIRLFTVLFTAGVGFFFACVLVRDLCRSGRRHNYQKSRGVYLPVGKFFRDLR